MLFSNGSFVKKEYNILDMYERQFSVHPKNWPSCRALIVGYGREGKAVERYLSRVAPQVKLHHVDKTDGIDYLADQHAFDFAIKSPGVSQQLLEIPYTTSTRMFFSHVPRSQIIGISGTKGKSTTASLIAHILLIAGMRVHLVGNIGVPALEVLASLSDEDIEKSIFVNELSSYQLNELDQSPHIAIMTSLFPEHMDMHGSVEQYFEAKRHMVAFQTADDYYIFPQDNPLLVGWAESSPAHVLSYRDDFYPTSSPLQGAHNLYNIRGAATVARILGVSDSVIQNAVACFEPLPHRLQHVGVHSDIIFYDDAISTTPESTIAALHALPSTDTIFLGGKDRGYDFRQLAKALKDSDVRNIVFFPQSGARIAQSLGDDISHFRVLRTEAMQEAVAFAYTHTRKGHICLLSTASPSYSLWKNFEEKGDQFQTLIRAYVTNAVPAP